MKTPKNGRTISKNKIIYKINEKTEEYKTIIIIYKKIQKLHQKHQQLIQWKM